MSRELKTGVIMATLESHKHIAGDIEGGVEIFNRGGVEFEELEPNSYQALVPCQGDVKKITVTFTRDRQDLKHYHCNCTKDDNDPPVCRHVVAAVLAIQGGIAASKLTLGKTASAGVTVTDSNTAKAVGSGSLDVFATPMMIALMERAACECLADALEPGQTSVGTKIDVAHMAASPVGAKITAAATITHVFGRTIEFTVTANDGTGEIGSGTHSRVIVDSEKFTLKAKQR